MLSSEASLVQRSGAESQTETEHEAQTSTKVGDLSVASQRLNTFGNRFIIL